MADKQFTLTSSVTAEQARIMLAVLVNLYGDNGQVVIDKDQFESLPEVCHLAFNADLDTGLITVSLKEVNDNE
jgi:hypothetical protein